jgi:peptidoglycan/xylan/chitin deacetylase (PgdA/CDA1 family)
MYHHVAEKISGEILYGEEYSDMVISPGQFEKQMAYLRQNGFTCLSLSEAVHNWQTGQEQPDRSFVLTFDDAYINIYKNVLPILKANNFVATVFVITRPVEKGNRQYLSWAEMRELAQQNFSFGSHTVSHPNLSNLDDVSALRELQDSKQMLEDRLGLPVDLLAFPYGSSNKQIQNLAAGCGYQAACGTTRGHWSLHNLWRIQLKANENRLALALKTNGGYYTSYWLREQKIIGRLFKMFSRG